ncbi:sensor histidine kinase [Parerythrobacter lacustris]|uniref:histidine kinase n=1 Tax=Parerythrobacter lacustris TaxID=2969984 RepID=A0ABT1XQQ1_9SPHN|nr:ATP-binding protein [Parerythrobacter lacustris]MCR2833989.1 ATP-binding protein [Parerythrobacter lacustris]
MQKRGAFPWAGSILAVATCVTIYWTTGQFMLSAAALIVWLCTLWLAYWTPPEIQRVTEVEAYDVQRVSRLIENSGAPILVTSRNRIIVANQMARKVLGAHVIEQDARVAFRQPEAIALIDQRATGRARIRGVARRRDVWLFNRQQLDDDLAVIELINQTAEEDISRAHTDFVANASHELRTPLASIIGYVETLLEGEPPATPEIRQKFLGTILNEANRLQGLVSDLMSLSRIEAEKHDRPQEIVLLKPLIEKASMDAAGLERQPRLDFQLDADPTVSGDPRQLEQLVRNLVDNALKYGDPAKPVTIALSTTDNQEAKLAVIDRGDGIAKEHLPHLTRRFYRTDPGRSRASGGTGLGLAIVKHIVERHAGRLDITSQQGQGSTFTVRIPLNEVSPENV